MPPSDLRTFVERSLIALEYEAPASYRRLCGALAGQRVGISADGRQFALDCNGRTITAGPADGREGIVLGTDRETILALIDGVLSLEDALRKDRLIARGGVTLAVRTFDALLIYLRGAVRCPSLPPMLEQFRAAGSSEEYRR